MMSPGRDEVDVSGVNDGGPSFIMDYSNNNDMRYSQLTASEQPPRMSQATDQI